MSLNPIYESVCKDLGYRPEATRVKITDQIRYRIYSHYGLAVMDPKTAFIITGL